MESDENAKQRATGKKEEWAGWTKEKYGEMTGDEQRKAEGTAQRLKGEGMQEEAKAEERGKGKVEEITGKIKSKVGDLLGMDKTQQEGQQREAEGQIRQKFNQ